MRIVLGKSPKIPGKSPKEPDVSMLAEVQDKLWEAVPPRRRDNRKSYFAFVAEELGWNPRRVRAYFHGEVRRIDPVEIEALNQRIERAKAEEKRHGEESYEIRESLGVVRQRGALDGGSPQRVRDEMAPPRGVVPRSDR